MTISIPGRVVVFDYGEVISLAHRAADRAELVQLLGTTEDAFAAAYDRRRLELDHGRVSVRDYWTDIAAELGVTVSNQLLQQLWVADIRAWISANDEVVAILDELAEGGTRLALLSNAGFDYGSIFRFAPTAAYFERIFVSAELGLVKPDPAIYMHVAGELGIAATEMVFVDNRADNVASAESLGVTGHVFTDAASLRDFLIALS